MPSSRAPGPAGLNPWIASTRTAGPLGTNKDAADPSTPSWFIGDTPRPTGSVNLPKHEIGTSPPKVDSNTGKSYGPQVQFAELVDLEDRYLPFIPDVMDYHGWKNASVLMQRWFSTGPSIAPNSYCPPDDTETIKMKSWLLTFQRVQDLYQKLINRITNTPTRNRLADVIKKMSVPALIGKPDSQGESRFGYDLSQQQWELCYLNSIAYEASPLDSIDDLFCSLGTFQLRLTGRGRCKPVAQGTATHRIDIWIESLGVYAFDSFDFTDRPGEPTQELGYWNIGEKSVSKSAGGLLTIHATNQSFCRYRSKHGVGGDFRVFSDIHWIQLDHTLHFAI